MAYKPFLRPIPPHTLQYQRCFSILSVPTPHTGFRRLAPWYFPFYYFRTNNIVLTPSKYQLISSPQCFKWSHIVFFLFQCASLTMFAIKSLRQNIILPTLIDRIFSTWDNHTKKQKAKQKYYKKTSSFIQLFAQRSQTFIIVVACKEILNVCKYLKYVNKAYRTLSTTTKKQQPKIDLRMYWSYPVQAPKWCPRWWNR